jgi:hypothetical protein
LSYKVLQLSPQASTDGIRARTAIQDSWGGVTRSREIGLPGSWIDDEYERDLAEGSDRKGAISGLALAAAFSASFWAGVALLVTRIWG